MLKININVYDELNAQLDDADREVVFGMVSDKLIEVHNQGIVEPIGRGVLVYGEMDISVLFEGYEVYLGIADDEFNAQFDKSGRHRRMRGAK